MQESGPACVVKTRSSGDVIIVIWLSLKLHYTNMGSIIALWRNFRRITIEEDSDCMCEIMGGEFLNAI